MKMYILVLDDVDPKFAIVGASHASLACYLKYKNDPNMQTWSTSIFYKVICKVNKKEFENARQIEGNVVITESRLENRETCMAFCPREEYPKMFSFFKLWSV